MTGALHTLCLICGKTEPLGLDICVNCGGAPEDSGDALVFLEPTRSRTQRHRSLDLLRRLVGPRQMPRDSKLLQEGHQALLRVRAGTARRVVDSLHARGINTAVRRAGTAWSSLPGPFYTLLAATMGMGTWVGISVDPAYLWRTPVISGCLWLAAQLRMRRPAISSQPGSRAFPKSVEREILDAFSLLSQGTARILLARLVAAAGRVFAAPEGSHGLVSREDLVRLVTSSCPAALALETVETSARDLSDPHEVMRAERIQLQMETRFRDAIGALHRLKPRACRTIRNP